MIIIISLSVLAAFFFLGWAIKGFGDDSIFWASCGIVFPVLLILVFLLLPFQLGGTRAWILSFEQTRQSLENARANKNISQLELAAIQQEVIKMNQALAGNKYWAKNPLTSFFWVKEMSELEPIR